VADPERKFEAELVREGDDTLVSIDTANKGALDTLSQILQQTDERYKVSYGVGGVYATVSFNSTSFSAGEKLIHQIFGKDFQLVTTYWFLVESGQDDRALLGAKIEPEPRTVTFALIEGDERSSEALWDRFHVKVTDESSSLWTSMSSGPDCATIVLEQAAWDNLKDTLLNWVRLFSFE
jgi:hypothetical protein